ncbi:MAG: CapA family protein [Ignavibacteriales bacterium]|nr:CapA family protein [Ignavibacteriales bacterium]
MSLNKFTTGLLFLLFLFTFNSSKTNNVKSTAVQDSIVAITISFVGDLMCHSPQFEFAKIGKDSFNFNPSFKYIRKYLYEADFTFGNLETVLAGRDEIFSGYPLFNSPDEYLLALKDSGFDFLFTSNNHSLDRAERGIVRTLKLLEQNKIFHTGTFHSQPDRDSIKLVDIKGIKVALISYSYGTNGNPIPKGKSFSINLIQDELIKRDIEKAKAEGADLVICYFHIGNEYERFPNNKQKETIQKTIDFGADLIICSHPHVIQPIEFFKSTKSNLDSVLVAYSLGNFYSNQRNRFRDAGVILNIKLKKNIATNKIKLDGLDYLPTWVFKGRTNLGNEFLILPSEKGTIDSSFSFLSEVDKFKMKQSYDDTKSLLTGKLKWIKTKRIYTE